MSGDDPLWPVVAPVYALIRRHPFVRGLADGRLPGDAFARYVVQDALFLRDYARALALCGARAGDPATLRMFCRHAAEAIDVERDLQERLMAELGIDPAVAARAEASPSCLGYGSFLLRACALGERHDALGAIVPCYSIYREVGRELAASGSPDRRYAAWIATYGGEEFGDAAAGAIAAGAAALAGARPAALASARRHARAAAGWEWLFWDAALRDERWPAGA